MKIGSVTLLSPFAIAPMAGMTDTAFRRLVKRHGGCGLVVIHWATFFPNQGPRAVSADTCAGVSGYFSGRARAWSTTRPSRSHWPLASSDRASPASTFPLST